MSTGSSTQYSYSAPQLVAMGMTTPAMKNIFGAAKYGGPAYPVLQGPQAPDLNQIPMYNLPTAPQPTAQWYNSLSPDVMAGLWSPYQQAGKQLVEQLGAQGQAGSARGRYSGAAGVALGELASQGAQNVGLQAWNMSQPGLMADYTAQLQRNQMPYQNAIQQQMADYQTALTTWDRAQQSYQYPYTIAPSLLGATSSAGIANMIPSSGARAAGAGAGAVSGALGGAEVGSMFPGYGTAIGAGLGGLLGAFGGYYG